MNFFSKALAAGALLFVAGCTTGEMDLTLPDGTEKRIASYAGEKTLDHLLIIDGVNHFATFEAGDEEKLGFSLTFRDGALLKAECEAIETISEEEDRCVKFIATESTFAPIPAGTRGTFVEAPEEDA